MAKSQHKKPSQSKKRSGQKSTKAKRFFFEETCFDGKVVYLPEGRWEWKIIGTHPDMAQYEQEVKETAIDPDLIGYEADTENVRIHASYDKGRGLYTKKYLWVPIKFMGEKGLILTAYWVDRIKPAVIEVKWRRLK